MAEFCFLASGNVGLSLGHPSVSTSLSGQFHLASKLVICALMIRGRHRSLPYALDRAIMLPTERAQRGQHPDDNESYEKNPKSEDVTATALGRTIAADTHRVPSSSSSASSMRSPKLLPNMSSKGLADASSLKTRTLPLKSHHTQ